MGGGHKWVEVIYAARKAAHTHTERHTGRHTRAGSAHLHSWPLKKAQTNNECEREKRRERGGKRQLPKIHVFVFSPSVCVCVGVGVAKCKWS